MALQIAWQTRVHVRRLSDGCPLLGGWDEEGFIKKVVSTQRETTVCQEALETRWTGPTDFPRTESASHKLIPALGTLTTAIAKSAIAWGALKPALMEVRRLCVERRCEKDPLKRKRLSIASHRARQLMRRKQADLRFKKAVEVGAPSRLQGPPPATRAPILEKIEIGRHNRKGGRPAGTHRHRPPSLQGAFHGSAAQRDSGMDVATMAI